MIDAAIIGLGSWGRTLVDSVQQAGRPKGERLRFVRAVTRTPSRVEDYARAQGLALGDDYAAALADPTVHAVVLATPHSQHASQVREAAAAGKHVFVEKPFTLERASAADAAAACERAGVVLALGHNRRFLPVTRDLAALVANGDLGTVLHLEGHFSGPGGFSYRPGGWRASGEESPAGGMTGMGIHVVDAMIHLCGRFEAVRALSRRRILEAGMDDTTSMLFELEGGMTGYLGTLAATARMWRLQVFGSRGHAEMRGYDTLELRWVEGEPETRRYPHTDMERAELEAFALAAGGGPAYPLPVDEAVHGAAVLEAIVRSAARDGERVVVERG
jgi:predicted dehydrogenase